MTRIYPIKLVPLHNNMKHMKRLKVALFDLDGTLIASEQQYTEFWSMTGKKFCPDIADFAYRIKGATLENILTTYIPETCWEEVTKGINDFEKTMVFPRVKGAEDFVRDLRSHGVQCFIVTSSAHTKMQILVEREPEFLSLFDRILTADDFKVSKPDPHCYIFAAEVAGAKRDECIVFEDAFTGLEAGMRSGIFTIGLATGNTREAIEDKCNFVIDNFDGLDYNELMKIWKI